MNWNYVESVRVKFGNGRLKELNETIQEIHGTNGLLVTSRSFYKKGLAEQLMKESEGKLTALYYEVSPNPEVSECQTCVDLIRQEGCDFVVALGGGSVMDCAKAAACAVTADQPITAYVIEKAALPDETLPVIAIPTTAGTASEVTGVSVLSIHEQAIKAPLHGSALYPEAAIIDPELTYTVPAHTTACTGMDVFCHAMEAYWNKNHQPICDVFAIHALQLVFKHLRTACKEPRSAEAREGMAEASLSAGMAFATTGTNSSHACSYPLTSLLGIAHGEACALTIDLFLHLNAAHDADGRLKDLAIALGFSCTDELEAAIHSLKEDIGLMTNLKQFSIDEELLQKIVKDSMRASLAKNPVPVTEETVTKLYRSLL